MANLYVTCQPPTHPDGSHHIVVVVPATADPSMGKKEEADDNGKASFIALTTANYDIYVCGTKMLTKYVSGMQFVTIPNCP